MNPADNAALRRSVAALFIVVAVAGVAGRVLGVGRVIEPWLVTDPSRWPQKRPDPTPTHGDNDRSRWATVRALVHDGTYAVGRRTGETDADGKPIDEGIITQDGWRTIDKVLHPEKQIFYSSKPPLLPTLAAGEYWLLRQCGLEITDPKGRWIVVPLILLTFNVLPWALSLWLLTGAAERYATTDWGRLFVVAAGCFATFLTTFATTFNNHSVAAWSTMFALSAALRIWSDEGAAPWGCYAVAGFFAAFAAVTELPAAAFAAGLGGLLLLRRRGATLTAFLPAALVPVAAFFVTNYLAIGEWSPAYEKFGGPWYDFEGSHWRNLLAKPTGIDAAGMPEGPNEPRSVYAFHLLLGHHGVFSLTPIFILSLVGMVAGVRSWRHADAVRARALAPASLLTLGVTVVVLGFYIFWLGDRSRNYGGWTSGPRWLFWLTPLWLVVMLPAADWLAARRGRRLLGLVLLAVSVLSVSYPQYNPWRHPWLHQLLEATGVVKY